MNPGLTRRQLVVHGARGAAVLALPGFLAACGGGGIGGGEEESEEGGQDRTLKTPLVISNWPLYIDIDEETKRRPTIQQFMDEYDIAVRYIEDVNDNNEFFAKIQPALSQGRSADRDLAVLTDWMAARLIRNGWVEELDQEALTNKDNLVEALRSPNFDDDRTYTMPWQSGLTGIGYNRKLTGGPVTTVEQLFTDSRLRGRVTLLTEMGSTLTPVMLENGDDPSSVDDASFERAIERIRGAVESGQVRQFTGNEYSGMMARGDVAAAFVWSGDIVQLQLDNPDLRFELPESGGEIWTDNMLVPTGGHAYTASTFVDFVYRPEVAAQIAAYVNYITPVQGAREALEEDDPETAENELIFPSDETLSKTRIFDAEAYENQTYRERFQELTGA